MGEKVTARKIKSDPLQMRMCLSYGSQDCEECSCNVDLLCTSGENKHILDTYAAYLFCTHCKERTVPEACLFDSYPAKDVFSLLEVTWNKNPSPLLDADWNKIMDNKKYFQDVLGNGKRGMIFTSIYSLISERKEAEVISCAFRISDIEALEQMCVNMAMHWIPWRKIIKNRPAKEQKELNQDEVLKRLICKAIVKVAFQVGVLDRARFLLDI